MYQPSFGLQHVHQPSISPLLAFYSTCIRHMYQPSIGLQHVYQPSTSHLLAFNMHQPSIRVAPIRTKKIPDFSLTTKQFSLTMHDVTEWIKRIHLSLHLLQFLLQVVNTLLFALINGYFLKGHSLLSIKKIIIKACGNLKIKFRLFTDFNEKFKISLTWCKISWLFPDHGNPVLLAFYMYSISLLLAFYMYQPSIGLLHVSASDWPSIDLLHASAYRNWPSIGLLHVSALYWPSTCRCISLLLAF